MNEELSKRYEDMQEKIEKGEIERNKTTIIDQIKNENAISLDFISKIIQERNQVIEEYAKDTINEGGLYFVLHKKNLKKLIILKNY